MEAGNPSADLSMRKSRGPVARWFWVSAGLGTAWNAYGVSQFSQAVSATRESLIATGMTEAQADAMSSYPAWMTAAFAIGTIGGLIGSILLLARKRQATAVFVASLAAYVVLYIGDITQGVFAAIGASQMMILSVVVVIAAALLWLSRRSERNGTLV